MPVADASALVHLLLGTRTGRIVASRLGGYWPLDAPHVVDLEIASALRRIARLDSTASAAVERAFDDLARLPLVRHSHTPLVPRIWELRHMISTYDASYVALAEALRTPLVTSDARLARAHGHRAEIDLVHA